MKLSKSSLWILCGVILIVAEGLGLVYLKYKSSGLNEKMQGIGPQLESISKEDKEMRSKYNDLLKENEAVKEDRNNLVVQAKTFLVERTHASEVEKQLEESVAKAQKEKEGLEQKMAELEKTTSNMAEEAKTRKTAQEGLEQERDKYKQAYDKERKEPAVKELKKEISDLQKEKDRLDSVSRNQQKDVERLKGENKELSTAQGKLKEEVAQYKKDMAEAQKKNKRLELEALNVPKKFAEIGRQNKILLKDTAQMHYNLGVFYTKNKEYDRAVAEFEKVVEINPDDSYAQFNLGYIYAEYLVNRDKAVEHFRHYLTLAKSDDKDIDWVKKYLLTWETFNGKKPME